MTSFWEGLERRHGRHHSVHFRSLSNVTLKILTVWVFFTCYRSYFYLPYKYNLLLSKRIFFQLQLFLSKLTGTQLGFTTCGLLTITKEFILTVRTLPAFCLSLTLQFLFYQYNRGGECCLTIPST